MLNGECKIISSESIRIASFALAGAGFLICPVFSNMHNKGHECLTSLFSVHNHYSEWELRMCPSEDFKFRLFLFAANSFSSYFMDINSYSSYLSKPGPSHFKEDSLQNNQMS